jgi:hypothetical protein
LEALDGGEKRLHLTQLENLLLFERDLSGEAISEMKPGDWPHLQVLALCDKNLNDNKEGARNELLHLNFP